MQTKSRGPFLSIHAYSSVVSLRCDLKVVLGEVRVARLLVLEPQMSWDADVEVILYRAKRTTGSADQKRSGKTFELGDL